MVDIFKRRTLKVKPDTPLIPVTSILAASGVMIDGRYMMHSDDNGTTIVYLATNIQQHVIDALLDHIDEFSEPNF